MRGDIFLSPCFFFSCRFVRNCFSRSSLPCGWSCVRFHRQRRERRERESLFFEKAQTRSFSSAFLARRRCTSFLIKEQLFFKFWNPKRFFFRFTEFKGEKSLHKARFIRERTLTRADAKRTRARDQKRELLIRLRCKQRFFFILLYYGGVIRESWRKVIIARPKFESQRRTRLRDTSRCKCYKSTHAVRRGGKRKCKTYPRRKQFPTSFERR